MNKKLAMYSLIALAMGGGMDMSPFSSNEKRRRYVPKDKKPMPQLKEFRYGENKVTALNKKNADKKAKKNNWI